MYSTSQEWNTSIYTNDIITLRPYSQRLNLSTFGTASNDLSNLRFIKMDTYNEQIPLVYNDTRYEIGSLQLRLIGNAYSEVVLDSCSFQLYIQHERIGAFSAMPTSRFWYV